MIETMPTARRERPEWFDQAACAGRLELFFEPHYERVEARLKRESHARALCRSCPVQAPCLELGMSEAFGIWGGLNEAERGTEKRRRRRRSKQAS